MTATRWIFAYGSLMWNPGIPVAETVIARVEGYARSFCLRSVCHRGTEASPGLVLGLDPAQGATCTGLALGIAEAHWPAVLAEIRARELVTEAYAEAWLPLYLQDGREVEGLAYVMRPEHGQYAGGLAPDEQAEIIARAHGGRGPNWEYLFNTVSHLDQIGLSDAALADLAMRVRVRLQSDGKASR